MSCSLLLQLGFFGIVGIPLFRAITELFKDAQPMMDGKQHPSCVCVTLPMCRLQVCGLFAVSCMLRILHHSCVLCTVLPEPTGTCLPQLLDLHACLLRVV